MNEEQQHWDKVYSEKRPTEVSWYEPMPVASLELLRSCELPKDAAIIDIGGGDSFYAEFLVAQEYKDITVVDISSKAFERAKERMCEKADQITWIVSDILNFKPQKQYDLWHDRATFHFLTDPESQEKYFSILDQAVRPGGFVVMGTFSDKGPTKCSGLEIQQYSVGQMQQLFQEKFDLISGKNIDHITPSGGVQNFTFCSFQKKNKES